MLHFQTTQKSKIHLENSDKLLSAFFLGSTIVDLQMIHRCLMMVHQSDFKILGYCGYPIWFHGDGSKLFDVAWMV
jgi:hypothetical protein